MDPENDEMQYAVPSHAFTATGKEKLYAILSYFVAYGYVYFIIFSSPTVSKWALAIFALVFCAATMLLHQERRGGWEQWVWLGCLSLCVLCPPLGRNRVWEDFTYLFAHGFAVYFVLCRANVLLGGRTGHLLPLDALYGAAIYPFGNFFLRIRTLACMARGGSGKARRQYLWAIPAVVLAVGLFIWITSLLAQADSVFGGLAKGLLALQPRLSAELLIQVVLSLPVGAYLYGLLVGTSRKTPEQARAKGNSICASLEKLRKVPNTVWVVLLAAFALLYAVFFAVQGRYLFGAFTRSLPENFTVAEYARQGFFELCKVMALNLLLLWLALRSAGASVKQNLPLKIMAAILLAEGMLFAIVAGSKLWLYIDCFGFTPLRLQSAWLICVLLAGCACAMYSLWTSRRSVRAWGIFSGVSLALLCLY